MYGTKGSNRVDSTATETERTAFRQAEKRYKLYKSTSTLKSRSKQKKQYLETDVSQVVDFDSVLCAHQCGEDLPFRTYRFQCPKDPSDHPIFCFRDRPGFYFIPGALSIEEQCSWIKASLKSFPQPPNRTNHTAIYGPLRDLLSAVENERVLVQVQNSFGNEAICGDLDESKYIFTEKNSSTVHFEPCKAIPASVLLRKLRWSTLGLQFDWSKRNYDTSLPHHKIHDALCFLSKEMATPAMPYGEEFHPEAAIVNYFGPSDMLGGHLDDMEADWSKPIVSISLGCKAIFLLGGKSREDTPVAMFLRTGDIVLMAGEARECFHGIPRIFTDEENSDISALLLKLSDEEGNAAILEYLKTSRININIRQKKQVSLHWPAALLSFNFNG